jgi:transcriptional regulator with XRE-family HTH domain
MQTDRVGHRATKGTEALWKAMSDRGMRQSEFARMLGCSTGLLAKWLYGHQNPKVEWAVKIERIAGVGPSLWGHPLTRPLRIPRAA